MRSKETSDALAAFKAGIDAINPSHYKQGKIEVIDFIEDQKLNFSKGSAIKYICRAGKKDPVKEIEDLKKAEWYIKREIERVQKVQKCK